MIQQFYLCVYTSNNWKQGLEDIFIHRCSHHIIHNGQKVETNAING